MFDQPYKRKPTNFPEEERLLRRLCRLLSALESLAGVQRKVHPKLANDLAQIYRIAERHYVALESRLHRPGCLRVCVREEAAKAPPPRFRLLIHLLASVRLAGSNVLRAHDAVVLEEGEKQCHCSICDDVYEMRWFLGQARRGLIPAFQEIAKGGVA